MIYLAITELKKEFKPQGASRYKVLHKLNLGTDVFTGQHLLVTESYYCPISKNIFQLQQVTFLRVGFKP